MKKLTILLLVCLSVIWISNVFADGVSVEEEIAAIQKMIKDQGLGWEAGYNEIMEWSPEERQHLRGSVIPEDVKEMFRELDNQPSPMLLNTQPIFDWRLLGGTTPVQNQGGCGSCWAFAAAAGFESAYLIATGEVVDLSEQAIVSCENTSNGCNGGYSGAAYGFLSTTGAMYESCMPYVADDIPCDIDDCEVIDYLEGYQPVPNDVNAIKNMLALGPLSTSFTAYDDFNSYQQGCYEHADTEPTNHAVLIVGWDDNECNGDGAWIVKNSWGSGWGRLGGYFYIKYGSAAFGSNTLLPMYHLEGVGELGYSPQSFELDIAPGIDEQRTLELYNYGGVDLRYYIDSHNISETDGFGYYWRDSNDSDGPTYNWIDITGIGEVVDFQYGLDNGNSGQLEMGFDFDYYDNTYDALNICTNGWASFNSGTIIQWENEEIPSWNLPNNMLAAFFDDLNMDYGGQVYFYTNNTDSAIVTFHEAVDSRQEGVYTFQIILEAPNNVIYQYNSMGPGRLDECTIGIENRLGIIGTQVVCDNPYIEDGLAVKFAIAAPPPPLTWFSCDPQTGVIPPGGQVDVTVTFNADDIESEIIYGMVSIMNNSMEQPFAEVPITITTSPTAIDDDTPAIPEQFGLQMVYPNPFNPSATINYSLPQAGAINLEIFNLLGQKVATLYNGYQNAGNHAIVWQPDNLSSGMYLVRLSNDDMVETTSITLMK
ncbi:MAG: T9SS type A sorting domain-containing protein [candidate division Zixibacteria bacterium]|nr:T9SS type A sorting domain-containing protein [candidate division Zixibacteria bacterium]